MLAAPGAAGRGRIAAVTDSRPFTLDSASGRRLHGIINLPEQTGPRPVVILSHGFKGFQEWAFLPSVAELLAQRGYVAVRFNYRGAGMRPGDALVTDLEAFRNATISQDLEDLREVIDAVGRSVAARRVDRDRLALLGFSRGGGVSLLAAAEPALNGTVRALVTWSAVGTFDRLGPAEQQAWRDQGELVIENTRTGQKLPLGTAVLDDLEANRQRFDLAAAAARRRAPWLIVHGTADETVPVAEAHALESAATQPYRLLLIADGTHTFQTQHPFAGPTPQLIEALNATQAWLKERL